MDIVFHIGANCTDEDRLLKSVLKNGDTLAAHGVKAPGPGKYRRLIRETIQNLDGAPPAPHTRQILLDAILDDETPQRLVMSNPNFICIANRIFDDGVFYQQAEFKLASLLRLFPEDRITLFLACRDPATFLPDCFAESKAADFAMFMQGFAPRDIRWSTLVARIRRVAPQVGLTVWCNEDTPLIWGDLIRALTGLEAQVPIDGAHDMMAAIMTPAGLAAFQEEIAQTPPASAQAERDVMIRYLQEHAIADRIEETVDLPGIDAAMLAQLSATYEEDMAAIATMPGVRFIAP